MEIHSVLVLFYLLYTCSHQGRCISLRERHYSYISNIIKQFKECPAPLYVYPPIPMRCASDPSPPIPYDYIRPVLLFWDPLNQLQCLNGIIRCPRPQCRGSTHGRVLRAVHWKDCHNQRESCRVMYGVNGPVYLVSRVYRCSGQHAEIIAHDPAILEIIPQSRRPFILSHITGVTRELHESIGSYITTGMKMEHIHDMMGQIYIESYTRKRICFEEDLQHFLSKTETPLETPCDKFPSVLPDEYQPPSITVIRDCFLYAFERKQSMYTSKMIELSAEWISIDHTFKVAANIGATRKCDARWEKQYDSMFCVMNDIGCVIAWQLSYGTAFKNVEDLLLGLKRRFHRQNKRMSLCFTDNCCSWRKKLQSVFGVDLTVKLDVFHAVQRIVKKIPKRHPFAFHCAQAFSLVFRHPYDHGERRTKPTPGPETMNRQLDSFVLTWKDIRFEEKSVLPLQALKEIENLRKHINANCLSNIPPGCGTERNENLHKCLRQSASKVRIGVHLVVALFTTFLYVWNEKRKSGAVGKKLKVVPAIESTHQADKADEKFGVGVSSQRSFNTDDDMMPVSYCDMISNCIWDDEEQNLEDLLDSSDFKMDKDNVKGILDRAMNLSAVTESVERCNGRNRMFNTDHVNLIASPALFALGTCINESAEAMSCEENLINTLSSYNMELVKSPADGNCLFSSIVYSLNQIVSLNEYECYRGHLHGLNLHVEDMPACILQLRKLLVSEWLANISEYECFVMKSEIPFQDLAESYIQDGVFAGELGNIMVTGLANILRINIVLYTSMTRMETIPVVPREKVLISCPVYLAFNHSGCGHYDAVVASTTLHVRQSVDIDITASNNQDDSLIKISDEGNGCRCGRGAARKDKKRVFCFQVPGERRVQCPCFRALKNCSTMCQCFNCKNPHGGKPEKLAVSKLGFRSREKHNFTGLRNTSLQYMLQCGEKPKDPNWNSMEKCVLKSLVDKVIEKGEVLNESAITSWYNELVEIVKGLPGINIPLGKKDDKDIKKMMKKTIQQAELFRQVYLQQIEENAKTCVDANEREDE